jgi:hypothetical protein
MKVRRIANKTLVSKPVGNKLLGRYMRRLEDDIQIDLAGIECV